MVGGTVFNGPDGVSESDHLLTWLAWLPTVRRLASESGKGCRLRLRRRIVGGVVTAGCDQAEQRGRGIAAFGDIPADGLYGVAANFTAYLIRSVRQNHAQRR